MIEEYPTVAYSMFCDQRGRELTYAFDDRDDMEDFARDEDWLIEEGSKGNNLHFCCHKCYLEHDRKEGEQ